MNEFSAKKALAEFENIPKEAYDILAFWFVETSDKQHFQKDTDFDNLIKERFLPTIHKLYNGAYRQWMQTPGGALAACIAVDQFSRNAFRDQPESFAHDHIGLQIAKHIRDAKLYLALPRQWRMFAFLPFMHSENLADQEECIRLGRELLDGDNFVNFAQAHHRIIARFGRFPHRNSILGRKTTPEEDAFLQEPNSSF